MDVAPTRFLNIDALMAAHVVLEPFQHLIVSGAIKETSVPAISSDFPTMTMRGSLPIQDLTCGPAFLGLVEELQGQNFRSLVENKFALDLEPYPTLLTVRGLCDARHDGKIHADLPDKLITVLLYLNETWDDSRGRLRLLRSDSLDDYFEEIAPLMGTMVIFRRCDWSWHGFEPLDAQRRSLQLNWVNEEHFTVRTQMQERFSQLLRLRTTKTQP